MTAVAFGLQGVEATTLRLYFMLYGIVNWRLVFPLEIKDTFSRGSTVEEYEMHGSSGVVSGWLHVTVTVTLSAPYCSDEMLSVGVYGISIEHVYS